MLQVEVENLGVKAIEIRPSLNTPAVRPDGLSLVISLVRHVCSNLRYELPLALYLTVPYPFCTPWAQLEPAFASID